VGLHRLLEPAVRLAFLAQHLHPVMRVRQATGLLAALEAVAADQPYRLPPMARRAVQAGKAAAVAAVVAVAAIRASAARAASAVTVTAS
jgi:hypothetical protein